MPKAKSLAGTDIPFPVLFQDDKLIRKVVPIFNIMHDTALSEKEAHSFLDLLWRYASEQQQEAKAALGPKFIVAEAEKTVIQEIRRYYDQRPFILDFDGIQIEVTLDMSLTDAMRKGMDATLSQVDMTPDEPDEPEIPVAEVIPEPAPEIVKHRKRVIKPKAAQAEAAPKETATPTKRKTPVKKSEPKPSQAASDQPEDEDDQSQYIGLQTYGVNPGEPLSRAVARVWPHRPALLTYNGKTIPITVEMSLVDAQIEAADVVGVDGNQVEPEPMISSSGFMRTEAPHPYDVAVFEHPIPVDDSQWNISYDRNSGADFVYTQRSVWLDEYPYRISCIPFDEYMNTQTMFYVHCKERPSHDMFDVYHELFRKHTHKVHVRVSNPSGDGSRILTHEYCSWRPKENGVEQSGNVISTVMEALGLNARWEPGARYRIRYWDTNVNCVNHRYYSNKPSDDALSVLRHPKLKPVVQSRPAGI